MITKLVRAASGSNAIKAVLTGAAAVAIMAAGVSEGSARSRHHHHRHHKHQQQAQTPDQTSGQNWRNANAAIRPSQQSGRTFSGIASHYGYEAGSKTASGQRLNANAMTAAHRSLPFGTRVRVTHRDRSVVVTINDRGPFVRGRVLDLTTGAARALGFHGLGKVTAEVL